MIDAGTTIGGYRVVRVIGRGGMGVVYEAVQTSVTRPVALKVLRPELADDPEFAERFRREARLQASLEHPHVLEVYDVGESEQGLFLAMRLASGRTLLDLLRDGELDATRALALLDQVTDALDAAHDAELVHRDVKPQNVLVDHGDRAYLADFGITRSVSETTVASSRPMLGSVAYVAPEIVRGEEPTPASDRYSLAATLFHCLTGEVVFPRGSEAAALYAHAAEAPPRAHERRPELPRAIDEVLGAALAKDPSARPSTARSIVGGAREALGGDTGGIGPPPVGPFPPPPVGEPVPGAVVGSPGRRRWLVLVAGGIVAAAAIGAGLAMLFDGDPAAGDGLAVPPVAPGAHGLGSSLSAPEATVDCRGREPTQRSVSCSIVQTELPGGEVLVPGDGVIVGWSVRGATGEVALDVVRPRGADTVRIARSQWESAGNSGPHYYETRIPVEAGDQIGVELGAGSGVGVTETQGATTQRWFEPSGGFYGAPDRDESTGFDYELALRADFVAGETVELPEHLSGRPANRAPGGRVRDRAELTIDTPREVRLDVELVEVDGEVVLDVLRAGRRTLRVPIAGLVPGGIPVTLKTYEYEGEPYGEADVWWVNPNSGRVIFHHFLVNERNLESAG